MKEENIKEQKRIAEKYKLNWFECDLESMVGLNDGLKKGLYPIHGLRHIPEGSGTGWFIWSGVNEIPQNDDRFFIPHHAKHIIDSFPQISKYLGLPPGSRFIIDDNGYEDVWFDEKLLNI